MAQNWCWVWMDVTHSRGLSNVDVKDELYPLLNKGV